MAKKMRGQNVSAGYVQAEKGPGGTSTETVPDLEDIVRRVENLEVACISLTQTGERLEQVLVDLIRLLGPALHGKVNLRSVRCELSGEDLYLKYR